MEERALLIYARRRAGVMVRARILAGGRSGARTLRLDVEGPAAQLASRVLVKLNSLPALDNEKRRYERFVAPFLPAGRYASLIEEVRAGAGDRGAAIYSLAGGDFTSTLFECIAQSGDNAAAVVDLLRTATAPWADAKEPEATQVGVFRAEMISDDAFRAERPRLGSAPVEEAEAQDVYVFRAPAHGDLHGGNVLLDDQNNPLLIDFGRAGPAVASLDPVTLELSAVLHPDSGVDLGGWPGADQAERWFSLSDYVTGCPIIKFVERCRAWAHDAARGDREVLTAAYSYAARQLQYATVNQDLALAYARGALNVLVH